MTVAFKCIQIHLRYTRYTIAILAFYSGASIETGLNGTRACESSFLQYKAAV